MNPRIHCQCPSRKRARRASVSSLVLRSSARSTMSTMSTILLAAAFCVCFLPFLPLSTSFRIVPLQPVRPVRPVLPSVTQIRPRIRQPPLFQSSSGSSGSAASEWMEKEKKLEEEMDQNDQTTSMENSGDDTLSEDTMELPGRWEYLHGNYILRPPTTTTGEGSPSEPSQPSQPRALLHFLGGALLGATPLLPPLTYRYLLERLSSHNYLIVTTPYSLSFDHLTTCDEIIDKFERVAPMLAREYGAVPVVGVGHSLGALLQVLITSLFVDTPRAGNVLVSYNNPSVGEAVPLFEEVVVPFFSDTERNGSEFMKSLIRVAREKYNGKIPSDESLLQLIQSLPTPLPIPDNLKQLQPPLPEQLLPPPLRSAFTTLLAKPTHAALTTAGLTPLLLQSLDLVEQIPKLIDEVAEASNGSNAGNGSKGQNIDFTPTPAETIAATKRAYRCRRTLILQFQNDDTDDSEALEGYLKEAESVMKMKRPMVNVELRRVVLEGTHLTPLTPVWGPLVDLESLGGLGGGGVGGGGELGELGSVLDVLGGVLGGASGEAGGAGGAGATSGKSGKEEEAEGGVEGTPGMSNRERGANAVKCTLGYDQIDRTVDEMVAWLDEGSL